MAIEKSYTLAAVYIVKNEAANLAVSLPSIAEIVDEIIVLDSGSSDDTREVCEQYKARFFDNTDWQGFGIQRQRAQAFATSDWILMLDADEEVDDLLKQSIIEIKKEKPGERVYSLRRLDHVFGKAIDSPYWIIPAKAHKRLYPRQSFGFCDSTVHESLQSGAASVVPLKGYLHHHTAKSPQHWLAKRLQYAQAWALQGSAEKRTSNVLTIASHTFFAFIKQYIIDGRFLAGRTGFIYAVLVMGYTFNKYAMLYDYNHQTEHGTLKE